MLDAASLSGLWSKSAAEFVFIYLDDVIVFSETVADHIKHLESVFSCLMEAGLMLNPKKCRIS